MGMNDIMEIWTKRMACMYERKKTMECRAKLAALMNILRRNVFVTCEGRKMYLYLAGGKQKYNEQGQICEVHAGRIRRCRRNSLKACHCKGEQR